MGQSFFIWNNVDCRSKGITLRGPVPIVRAEERVQHVEIPGRAGDMTETEGENIFNSYIQTASISVRGAYNVRNVYKWMRGAGFVTFSGEPDKRQAARIIGAITLNRISRNMDRWAGEVQFYCQPLKEKLIAEADTVAPNGVVKNTGDVDEYPLIELTSTGTSVTVTAGGKSLTISSIESGTVLAIDCAAKNVIMTADSVRTDITGKTTGEWPKLAEGENAVTGSGWSTATIRRRERFL